MVEGIIITCLIIIGMIYAQYHSYKAKKYLQKVGLI